MNKDMGQFILFTFVYFLIQFGVNMLTSAIGGGTSAFSSYGGGDFEDLMNAGQILSSTTGWVIGLALAPLSIGSVLVAKKVFKNEDYQFKDFFSGYNWFLPIVLASLVTGLITGLAALILTIPWVVIGITAELPIVLVIVVAFILILPGIYLGITYSLTNYFIVFRNYNFWPAMEASRKLISKNFWSFFAFLFLLGCVNLLGIIPCGIGLLFTIPLTACATYAAYYHIVRQGGAEEEPTVDGGPPPGSESDDPFGFDTPPPPPPPGSSPTDKEDPFLN